MDIVFFAHPAFLELRSMDSFTSMLATGMRDRGHHVQIWHPKPTFLRLAIGGGLRKWLGYVDQFILFPAIVKLRIRKCSKETLFVFTDQALGPWIPIVRDKRHVIHCHDFLALESANGHFPEHKTKLTGKVYQRYIRKGFTNGKNFIAVSKKTSEQLTAIHPEFTIRNEVVYNGLQKRYAPIDQKTARNFIMRNTEVENSKGYILHVGGNQWYKNRIGVIEIYNAWRHICQHPLPLLLVGERPTSDLLRQVLLSDYSCDIHFIFGKDDQFIHNAYCGASVLLFPSLAEGFGWPIAEAMACGCPVITTNMRPMTEVGAKAAFYIDRRPQNMQEQRFWAYNSAEMVETVICAPDPYLQQVFKNGLENSKRFNLEVALDKIEKIYSDID